MRHLLLIPALFAGCASPLPDVPDGGLLPTACFAPSDGGVFSTGLPSPVPGCALPGPSGVLDLADAGWSRQGGLLVVPPSTPGAPLPVVFVFHGAGGTGEDARMRFALEGPADGGAIFVYPNAIQGTWDIGPSSVDGRRVELLLRRLSEAYCIDPRRISIAGFSAGAVFTLYLGCNVPGSFLGMAAVAGTDQRFDDRCCTGSISTIVIHGTQDEAFDITQARTVRGRIAARDQCTLSSASQVDPLCLAYSCQSPWSLNYCEWSGDHDIPVWGGQEIWRFLSGL